MAEREPTGADVTPFGSPVSNDPVTPASSVAPNSSAAPNGGTAPNDGTPAPFDPGLPWGFVAFFAGFGGFFLVSLVITGVAAGVSVHVGAVSGGRGGPAVLLALLPNLLLGLGPAALSWWRGKGPRIDFGIRFTRADLAIGFSSGMIALAVGLAVNYVLENLVFRDGSQNNVAEELGQLTGGRSVWLLIAVLFLVFVSPLTEELLMRGALWGALEHQRLPRWAILALTSLIFAFLHQEPTLTLALFCQGLAIGSARMRTGRIGASMIAHATNNLIPALVLWFASKP